jgi:SEC-C motif-containing protein
VLETTGGGLFDATGTVSFRAIYVLDGQRHVLTENSRFVREGKRWLYLGSVE